MILSLQFFELTIVISTPSSSSKNITMVNVKDTCDMSVSKDSVFDWGGSSRTSNDLTRQDSVKSTNSSNPGPSSRYDPKAMSRIVDITDLVDDSGDDLSDDEMAGHNSSDGGVGRNSRNSGSSRRGSRRGSLKNTALGGVGCRQVLVLSALVAIIAGASLAIGYAVIDVGNKTPSKGNPQLSVRGADIPETIEAEQANLETAERIVIACAESKLDEDMSECQRECEDKECCFEDDPYSCRDTGEECAVYAGCVALFEGFPEGGAAEDEE